MAEHFMLDKASIMDRLAGDEEIYAMMVDTYLEDLDGNCRVLHEALQARDFAVLQREAHTIKGLLATFSDDVGADMAFALERKAKLQQDETLAVEVGELQARLREVGAALRGA